MSTHKEMLAKLPHIGFGAVTLMSGIGLLYSLITYECSLQTAQNTADAANIVVFGAKPATWLPTLWTTLTHLGPGAYVSTLGITVTAWTIYNLFSNNGTFAPGSTLIADIKASARSGIIWGLVVCILGSLLYTWGPDFLTARSGCDWVSELTLAIGAIIGVGGALWAIISACKLGAYTLLFDDNDRPRANAANLKRIIAYGAIALTAAVLGWYTIMSGFGTNFMISIFLGILFVFGTWLVVRPRTAPVPNKKH